MYHYFGTVYALKAQRTGTFPFPFQSEQERSDGPLAFPTGTVQRTANVPDLWDAPLPFINVPSSVKFNKAQHGTHSKQTNNCLDRKNKVVKSKYFFLDLAYGVPPIPFYHNSILKTLVTEDTFLQGWCLLQCSLPISNGLIGKSHIQSLVKSNKTWTNTMSDSHVDAFLPLSCWWNFYWPLWKIRYPSASSGRPLVLKKRMIYFYFCL